MYSVQLSFIQTLQFKKFVGKRCTSTTKLFEVCDVDDTQIVPGLGTYDVTYKNETYSIMYREEGDPFGVVDPPKYYRRMVVTHDDYDALVEFVRTALSHDDDIKDRTIKIYSSVGKGYWDSKDNIYSQTLDDIFIPEKTKSDLVDYIDTFLNSKERYVKFGRMYKLGFLLTGVPGSGKTSLVKAIALKYKRPVYIINFTKTLTDDSFIDLMSNIKDDSILLIEDIDSFFMDRQAQNINISFSALLNVLDGVLSKGNGILVFITANNPDRLDSALIRPGRIDKIVKFEYPRMNEIRSAFMSLTHEGTHEKFTRFYEKIHTTKNINMSALVDLFFRFSEDYMEHVNELLDQVKMYSDIVKTGENNMYN